jgi:hypothetical protein
MMTVAPQGVVTMLLGHLMGALQEHQAPAFQLLSDISAVLTVSSATNCSGACD